MKFKDALCAGVLLLLLNVSHAVTLRVGNQGDAQSMDPHSLNEALQHSFLGNIYEPLVGRDKQLALAPVLASRWDQVAPSVWRFTLRQGVKFHDGTPFTADDVLFSFKRASGAGSDMKSFTSAIKQVRKLGPYEVEIETRQPMPTLPDTITLVYMMSERWCKENNATEPVDRRRGIENTASFKANGTGPFRLKERQPAVRTVLVRHGGYWAPIESNVTEVVFTPISNDATRVAAMLSGELDVMEPVPLQDLQRLKAAPHLKVMQGPELRTIFLGMDQKRDELLFSNIKGRNPFKDQRVRQAFYQAIDIESIRSKVMRGSSVPTALMVAPGIKGFAPELNKRLAYDPDMARRLLGDAGYPDGFELEMNCPNDRYVNDSEICQAVAANLARIGIKINLRVESKATYFPKVLSRNSSFFLLGWVPIPYDSLSPLSAVMSTPNDKGDGQFNLGGYSNPTLDELTLKIQSEADGAQRNKLIRQAFEIHQREVGHIPLHQQALAWVAKKNVQLVQLADNFMPFQWVVVK